MRTGACIPWSGGICHEGSEGEITELEKSPLDSFVSSTSWDAPRGMAWAAGLVPPGDPACACHRSPRRWNHKRPRFSLGGPHGVGPLPWPASWHRLSPLGRSMSSALLGCHGTLRRRRNLPSKRLPRVVSWRKTSPLEHSAASAGGCAVDRAEGDRFVLGAVPLGAFRGKYVVVGSKGGELPRPEESPLGRSGTRMPWRAPKANAPKPWISPLASVAASDVALGFFRAIWRL